MAFASDDLLASLRSCEESNSAGRWLHYSYLNNDSKLSDGFETMVSCWKSN